MSQHETNDEYWMKKAIAEGERADALQKRIGDGVRLYGHAPSLDLLGEHRSCEHCKEYSLVVIEAAHSKFQNQECVVEKEGQDG